MTNDPVGGLSDEERDKYREEWEQVSEKALLAQILAELQQIRVLLSGTTPAGATQEGDDAVEYECDLCDWSGPEGDRERHARGQHKCPPGEWAGMFTERETQ